MGRFFSSFATLLAIVFFVIPVWADKVVVLPFTSPTNVPRPELEEVRTWTLSAVAQKGHSYATEGEVRSAMAAVADGVPDTSQEYVALGKAAGADWTLAGHVERSDHPPAEGPAGQNEEGYTTYRVELEACQVSTGRVESLSREVLVDQGPDDIAPMMGLLLRPEGIANAEVPWERNVRRPKPRPKPLGPPTVPALAPPSEARLPSRRIYGDEHPLSLGASLGVTNALVRPDGARGPSAAMPIGIALGVALPDAAPGVELVARGSYQAVGPAAFSLAVGGRYALAPIRDCRLFMGPELLLGAFGALGAAKTVRFLTQGAIFVAYGITEIVQVEIAGDLSGAFGGSGTLLLAGAAGRFVLRWF